MDAIEGLRVSLGPGIMIQYILTGLFHPARRVREIYWRIYNNMYIGSQDGLVPFYPRVEGTVRNRYERTELEIFI